MESFKNSIFLEWKWLFLSISSRWKWAALSAKPLWNNWAMPSHHGNNGYNTIFPVHHHHIRDNQEDILYICMDPFFLCMPETIVLTKPETCRTSPAAFHARELSRNTAFTFANLNQQTWCRPMSMNYIIDGSALLYWPHSYDNLFWPMIHLDFTCKIDISHDNVETNPNRPTGLFA